MSTLLIALCLLLVANAQPQQPETNQDGMPGVQPSQPGMMAPNPSNVGGPSSATTPAPNPNVAIPQMFQRGPPEQYSLALCDESVEVPCDNDLLCLRVGALRNENSEKSYYRCVQGKCKKTSCLFDNDCEEDEFCNANGACAKLQYVGVGETCKPEQAILCRPPLQCNLQSSKCEEGLLEGASCDASGQTLWPPCPKDFACIQWDSNNAKCTKQVLFLRQEDQTCSTARGADPFTKCAEGLACVGGKCKPEIVPESLVKSSDCSATCSDNKECVTRICRQGKCLERALLIGEKCSVNEQCVSGQCEQGKCSGVDCSVSNCPEGKICTFDRLKRNFSCVEDPTLCNDDKTMIYMVDKCVQRPRLGESCEVGSVPCVDPYHCDFQQRKCVDSETREKSCAWNSQYMDNCTVLGKEACQCSGQNSKCKVVDPQQIISSKIANSDRCVRFTTRNSPLFNQCVRELSQFSPASALFDVASRDLKNCKKYWATFYCCSICMGVELDLLNKENMTEKIQTYLPGLQCNPEPKWNVNFGTSENGKCVFKGFTEPKSRNWYKDQMCGNFLEEFNSKKEETEMPIQAEISTNSSSSSSSGVVETQQPYGTEPAHNQAVNESYFTRPARPSLANTQSGYGAEPAHDQGLAFAPANPQPPVQELPVGGQTSGNYAGQSSGNLGGQTGGNFAGQQGGQQMGPVLTQPLQPYNQPPQQPLQGGQTNGNFGGQSSGSLGSQQGSQVKTSDGKSLVVGALGAFVLPLLVIAVLTRE